MSATIEAHIGARIRKARETLNVSQERLAEALGVTFQQVQHYERGRHRIAASQLLKVSGALGVALPFFFDGLERPPRLECDTRGKHGQRARAGR